MTHHDFRGPKPERRIWDSPSRRKEDLALMLGVENLKLMRDMNAGRDQIYKQIDDVYALLEQVMNARRPQPEVPGATDTDAAHEQPKVA